MRGHLSKGVCYFLLSKDSGNHLSTVTSDLVTPLSCCCVLMVTSVQWSARLDCWERLSYRRDDWVWVNTNENIGG